VLRDRCDSEDGDVKKRNRIRGVPEHLPGLDNVELPA
jgi:hypothetical protein